MSARMPVFFNLPSDGEDQRIREPDEANGLEFPRVRTELTQARELEDYIVRDAGLC